MSEGYKFNSYRMLLVVGTVLGIGMLLGLSGCSKPAEETAALLPRPIKVFEVHNGGVAQVLEYPGQIEAAQISLKSFEVEGRIIEMHVKEGQEVHKGEILAQLDPRDYRSDRDFAQANYDAALSVADRVRRLFQQDAISRQELDIAERDLKTAQANLDRAQKALEDTTMVADFEGKIARIYVDDFANVVAKEQVLVLLDDSKLEIVVQVPESVMAIPVEGETDAERVARAQPVVILSAIPDKEYPAILKEASETPDPITRTYEVTLEFDPEEDHLVMPGMTAKVKAVIPPNDTTRSAGYVVPANSIVTDWEGKPFVWKLDPESMTVSKVLIEAGAMTEDVVSVQGEVSSGDLIAASGVAYLSEGQEVRIWNP